MKQHSKPTHRKPWKEEHQLTLTCGAFLALLALGIVGIGWKDGYWASTPQTINSSIRGPR